MSSQFKLKFSAYLFLGLLSLLPYTAAAESKFNENYQAVEWPQLMPKDDLDALMDPPDYLANIDDGSESDSVDALNQADNLSEKAKRYQQALNSTRIIPEFDKKNIRIPGFVVPVHMDASQRAISFFIVPYFGACLHMPPPPPNQIIYVDYEQGLKIENLYNPFWFEGKLMIKQTQNEIAAAAYQMKVEHIMVYDEE